MGSKLDRSMNSSVRMSLVLLVVSTRTRCFTVCFVLSYCALSARTSSFFFVGDVSMIYSFWPNGRSFYALPLTRSIILLDYLNEMSLCLIGIKFALSMASWQARDQKTLGDRLQPVLLFCLKRIPKQVLHKHSALKRIAQSKWPGCHWIQVPLIVFSLLCTLALSEWCRLAFLPTASFSLLMPLRINSAASDFILNGNPCMCPVAP